MAKQIKPNRNIEWENKLGPEYQTMVDGFHSNLSVKELVTFWGHDTEIPEEISHIKLRNFTPELFKHSALKEFWQTPVSKDDLEKKPSVLFALNDEDFQEVQDNINHEVDIDKVTYETLARLVTTQETAYYNRISQLVRDNLVVRLEKLRQPEFYNKLRNCNFVKQNKLENILPKDPPKFNVAKGEFNVKKIESAVRKAYEIKDEEENNLTKEETALKEKGTLEKFLAGHETYGNSRLRDMLRTSIDIPRDNVLQSEKYKHYMDVRNLLYVAMNSGEIGMVCNEFVDSVNHPPTRKTKDLYPTGNAKGEFFHAGLNGTLLSVPLEIQLPYMRDDLIEATHNNMKESRLLNPKDPIELQLKMESEEERKMIYNSSMHEEIIQKREAFLEKIDGLTEAVWSKGVIEAEIVKYVAQTDKIGAAIVKQEFRRDKAFSYNIIDISGERSANERRATVIALDEFPEEKLAASKNAKKGTPVKDAITKLDPSSAQVFRQTMAVLCKPIPVYDPQIIQLIPDRSQPSVFKVR